jgi:hypothetical protein
MKYKTIVVAALVLSTLCGSRALAEAGPQQDVNNILSASLGSIDDSYRGQHQYFNDDVIGNLIEKVVDALGDNVLKPFLSGLQRGDPLCLAVAAALAVVAAGFLFRSGANLSDALTRPGPKGGGA